MASPQLENGYLKIANEIIEALTAYRLPGEQMQCLLFILRKTYGFNKISDMISNSQFVTGTGLKKPNVCRAIKGLINKNIVIKIDNNYVPTYQFNKNYKTWKVLSKKITAKSVIKTDNQVLSKLIPTKDIITKDNLREDFKFEKLVPIPKDIFLTERMKAYVAKQGCENSNHAEKLFEDFKNHHGAKGTKWQDWTMTFFKWVRQDKKFNPDNYKKKIYYNV